MGKYIKKIYNLECKLCGDTFQSNNKNGKYCKKKHYKKCLICEEEFEIKVPNRPAIVCSQRCVGLHSRNNVKVEEQRQYKYKVKCEICKEEFGTNNKRKKYCNKIHTLKCQICKKDFEAKTAHEKYCKDQHYKPCEICGEEFKIIENHRPGRVCSFKCGAYLTHKRNPQKKKDRNKRLLTRDPKKLKEWKNLEIFLKDKDWTYLDISEYFGTNTSHVGDKIRKENLDSLVKTFYRYTKPELEIKEILLKMGLREGEDFEPHNRRIIKPLEVDFYIPKFNLAIEVSPTFTHSVKESFLKQNGIEKDYHKIKFDLCREKGIFLITIFEWYTEDEIISAIENHIKKIIRDEKKVIVDLSIENPQIYKDKGYKKIRECPPKLFYHIPNKQTKAIKSKKIIMKHKDVLEKNGFLPIYNCGYEIWELT